MHLPHLSPFQKTPIVFLTTCTKGRVPLLANDMVHAILKEVWTRSADLNGWFVGHYVLMPDHLHMFAQAGYGARPLSVWMRTWKSITATRINRTLLREEAFWQTDYFDRYLRSFDDYREKWKYIALNPVRKGLVANEHDWPYRGIIHELRSGADGPASRVR